MGEERKGGEGGMGEERNEVRRRDGRRERRGGKEGWEKGGKEGETKENEGDGEQGMTTVKE